MVRGGVVGWPRWPAVVALALAVVLLVTVGATGVQAQPAPDVWEPGPVDRSGVGGPPTAADRAGRVQGSTAPDGAVAAAEAVSAMSVASRPFAGDRGEFSYVDVPITDRSAGRVNVASGNLLVQATDVSIAGTGQDLEIVRSYNSLRADEVDDVGHGWRLNHGSDVWIAPDSSGVTVSDGSGAVWQYANATGGAFTAPAGANAQLVRNADGSYTLTENQSGVKRTFTQQASLRFALAKTVDRNGNEITAAYDSASASQPYNNAPTTLALTDTQNRRTSLVRGYWIDAIVDPANRRTDYLYDGNTGTLTRVTDPAGGVTTYGYDNARNLTRITDPAGDVTTFTYDSQNRVTSYTRVTDLAAGTGPTTRLAYFAASGTTPARTEVTDANNHKTTHHHDSMGRVTKTVDALGREQSTSYTANSNVATSTDAGANVTTYGYSTDGRNNPTSARIPTGATTTMAYTDADNPYAPSRMTSPQGNALTYDYDTAGNVDSVTDSTTAAGKTDLTRNANGTVSTSNDPRGNTTTYTYDSNGRGGTPGNLTRITPPAPLGATDIEYDGLSRVTAVTDGNRQRTTYGYDALDRVTSITHGDGSTVTYRYNGNGAQTEQVDATGTRTYTYDRIGRLERENLPGSRSNAYTYDAVDNLKTLTDASGTVTYNYNAVNLLTSLVEPYGNTTTFGYDTRNNRTTTTYPNGVVQTAAYDNSSRITSIEGKKGTTVLTRFAYSYLRPGSSTDRALRYSVTDHTGATTSYTYDPLDRLTRALTKTGAGTTTADLGYGYDAAGNRTSETINTSATSATFNAANQLTGRGGVTYSYDANGNQTGSSAGQQLSYNAADQTTSMKQPGGTALTATYAGVNQVDRATAGADTFTNSTRGVIAQNGNGLINEYTRDNTGGLVGLRNSGNRYYYLFDGLGSVTAVTDPSGNVVNRYTYDPYGKTTETKLPGAVTNPWRYTGEYQDTQTGLYKIGHRYYQPDLGRWTQPDPAGLVGPDDGNLYTYVNGNPVNYVDSDGLARRVPWRRLARLGGTLYRWSTPLRLYNSGRNALRWKARFDSSTPQVLQPDTGGCVNQREMGFRCSVGDIYGGTHTGRR